MSCLFLQIIFVCIYIQAKLPGELIYQPVMVSVDIGAPHPTNEYCAYALLDSLSLRLFSGIFSGQPIIIAFMQETL